MRSFELRRWLIESAEEDLWWLSINGEVYDIAYDLSEIEEIALDFVDQDLRVRHVSATNVGGESDWLKYEPDIKAMSTNQIMVQDEAQANSVIAKNTERKKNSLTKTHVYVVVTSWAILVGWGLRREYTLNLSESQVEELEEKIKLQEGEISSLNWEFDDLQEASLMAIRHRDELLGQQTAGFDELLAQQTTQFEELRASYLALVDINKKLRNLNSELASDSAKRSAMIVTLQNQINQDSRQMEAIAALEREKIRLIRQQNQINHTIAKNMEADRLARNLQFLNVRLNKPEPVFVPTLDNTQWELDDLNRRLDDAEFERKQREFNEDVRRNREAYERQQEQDQRAFEESMR